MRKQGFSKLPQGEGRAGAASAPLRGWAVNADAKYGVPTGGAVNADAKYGVPTGRAGALYNS